MFRWWTQSEKVSRWTKAEVIIQAIILVIAGLAIYYAWDASKTTNIINQRSLDLQNKLYNYPLEVIPYPYYALIDGHYVNGSSLPAFANGYLNATFIISSPDVIKLTIENMTLKQIYTIVGDFMIDANGRIVDNPEIFKEFNDKMFDQWNVVFEANSPFRQSSYPRHENNFTYYTTQAGISTINATLPIDATFYLNPDYNFTDYQSPRIVDLGLVTVNALAFDMQTKEQPKAVTLTIQLLVEVRITDH